VPGLERPAQRRDRAQGGHRLDAAAMRPLGLEVKKPGPDDLFVKVTHRGTTVKSMRQNASFTPANWRRGDSPFILVF
jgi:hypothetical protein